MRIVCFTFELRQEVCAYVCQIKLNEKINHTINIKYAYKSADYKPHKQCLISYESH